MNRKSFRKWTVLFFTMMREHTVLKAYLTKVCHGFENLPSVFELSCFLAPNLMADSFLIRLAGSLETETLFSLAVFTSPASSGVDKPCSSVENWESAVLLRSTKHRPSLFWISTTSSKIQTLPPVLIFTSVFSQFSLQWSLFFSDSWLSSAPFDV